MYFDKVLEECPKMPIKETEKLIIILKEISRTATMESASFGNNARTKSIMKDTDLWRKSWIIGPLDSLIERYEAALKNQRASQ